MVVYICTKFHENILDSITIKLEKSFNGIGTALCYNNHCIKPFFLQFGTAR